MAKKRAIEAFQSSREYQEDLANTRLSCSKESIKLDWRLEYYYPVAFRRVDVNS